MASDAPMIEVEDRYALAGTVQRVTYQNAETGFCVLRVEAPGYRKPVAVVGRAAAPLAGGLREGVRVRAVGLWTHHPRHGLQFEAETLDTGSDPARVPDGPWPGLRG